MKPLVAVAISGGIDSLVSAFLLKKEGYPLIGVHFTTGYETAGPADIARMADQVGIPLHVIDCAHMFKSVVVNYFIDTYRQGRTPNPCLVCNPHIKFTAVFEKIRELTDADYLATGHYVKVIKDHNGRFCLMKGRDVLKDQSYFLAFLTQQHLSKAMFPLGDLTKKEVRNLAAENGLQSVSKEESQDVCFIRNKTYTDFLAGAGGFMPDPGPVTDTTGRIIGEHQGLYRFTVGQRKGINIPADRPYYVIRLDTAENRLVVGYKEELLQSACRVSDVHWIDGRIVQEPAAPVNIHVKVRYRHKAVPATLVPEENRMAEIRFDTPEAAVTPGQGAVFYQGDQVLGGGWIES